MNRTMMRGRKIIPGQMGLAGLSILLAAFMLAGCQLDISMGGGGQPVIQTATLTESEQQLLTAVGVERAFAFDINLDKIEFEQVSYKVDYYAQGEYVETITEGAMGSFLESGTHRLLWSQTNLNNSQHQLWHVAFAGGRLTQQIEIPERFTGWTWSQVHKVETLELDQPVMLAVLVGTSTGSLRSADVIFDETEGGLEALGQYEAAYVLTVTFRNL